MIKELQEYKKSKEKQVKLSNERDKKREEINKEYSKIHNDFWEKERSLREQKYKDKDKVNKKKDDLEKSFDPMFEENYKPIAKLKRILGFLMLKDSEKNVKFEDGNVYNYRDRYLEDLGYIFLDNFYSVKAFIYENDKPKNKYALVIIGKCLFGEDFIKFNMGCFSGLNDKGASLRNTIKESPKVEDLREYFNKNKEKILSFCKIDEYEEIKKEYLKVIESYNLQDFEELKEFEEFRGLDENQKKIVDDAYEKEHPGANKQIDRYEYYEENKERFNFKVLKIYNL